MDAAKENVGEIGKRSTISDGLFICHAYNSSGVIVMPHEASKAGAPYKCMDGCDLTFREPKSGRRRRHFAHFPKDDSADKSAHHHKSSRETMEHIAGKSLLKQRLGSYVLTPICHMCNEAVREVRFDPGLFIAETEQSVLERKYVVDVAVFDRRKRQVHTVLEVHKTHEVSSEKWRDLSTEFGGRVFEIEAAAILKAFDRETVAEDKKSPIVIGCKTSETLACDKCREEQRRKEEWKSKSDERKSRRPCAGEECGPQWFNMDLMTPISNIEPVYYKGRHTQQFVCRACRVTCPTCQQPCTKSHISKFRRCVRCRQGDEQWLRKFQTLETNLPKCTLADVVKVVKANPSPDLLVAESVKGWEMVGGKADVEARERCLRRSFLALKYKAAARLAKLKTKREEEKKRETLRLAEIAREQQELERKEAGERKRAEEEKSRRELELSVARGRERVKLIEEGKERLQLVGLFGSSHVEACDGGAEVDPVTKSRCIANISTLLACRKFIPSRDLDMHNYLESAYPMAGEKKRLAEVAIYKSPPERIKRLNSGQEPVKLCIAYNEVDEAIRLGAVRVQGRLCATSLPVLFACRHFIIGEPGFKTYIEELHRAQHGILSIGAKPDEKKSNKRKLESFASVGQQTASFFKPSSK